MGSYLFPSAISIPDGGVATADLADDAITEAKLDSTIQLSRAQLAMDEVASVPTATAGAGFVAGSSTELAVTQLASPSMAVRVQVAGTAYNHLGARIAGSTSASIAVTAADATNDRQDIVVLTAAGAYAVRAGTPDPAPADPTLTAGDVPLARLAIAAMQADVQTANITDLRERGGIDGEKLIADSVDSQAYAAGSIDAEHLAANSVDSAAYVDGSIDAEHLAAAGAFSDDSGSLTKADAGTVTLMPAVAGITRYVVGCLTVAVTIADGDGAQPTFAVGETDTTEKFIAASVLTGGTAGTRVPFHGVLTAAKALIVTVGAGSGTTQAGTVSATAVALK